MEKDPYESQKLFNFLPDALPMSYGRAQGGDRKESNLLPSGPLSL